MKCIVVLVFISSIIGSFILGSKYYYLMPFNNTHMVSSAIINPIHNDSVKGVVRFTQEKNGIRIIATIHGLTPGKHGFHIHNYGNCGGDNGTCAGDHFNPTHAPHGSPNDAFVHAGDLGNLIADENGIAHYNEINYNIAFSGPGCILGRSVIVHADPDDLHSQPNGNSGKRIGCGIIAIDK